MHAQALDGLTQVLLSETSFRADHDADAHFGEARQAFRGRTSAAIQRGSDLAEAAQAGELLPRRDDAARVGIRSRERGSLCRRRPKERTRRFPRGAFAKRGPGERQRPVQKRA